MHGQPLQEETGQQRTSPLGLGMPEVTQATGKAKLLLAIVETLSNS